MTTDLRQKEQSSPGLAQIENANKDPQKDDTNGKTYGLETILFNSLWKSNDRLLVLRLERELLAFLTSGPAQYGFSPMNSYFRLLVHQLAQYYQLDHVTSGDSVVVYKKHGVNYQEVLLQVTRLAEIPNEEERPKLVKVSSKLLIKDKSRTDLSTPGHPSSRGPLAQSEEVPQLESVRASKEALYNQARERIFQSMQDEDDGHEVEEEEEEEEQKSQDSSPPQPQQPAPEYIYPQFYPYQPQGVPLVNGYPQWNNFQSQMPQPVYGGYGYPYNPGYLNVTDASQLNPYIINPQTVRKKRWNNKNYGGNAGQNYGVERR